VLALSPRRGWELVGYAWFAAVGITAAFVDLRVRRLPNQLTAAAAVVERDRPDRDPFCHAPSALR
jgi:hypothetical protein